MGEEQIFCGNSICCDGLPTTLSTNNHPWLVAKNLDDDNGIVNFYTMDEQQPSNYRCRIPELHQLGGKGIHIQGFCHGWMILSNDQHNVMWSLWNPVTSKLIRLPPLEGSAAHDFGYCCLSSPPGDPTSIFLLARLKKPNFVFCRLKRKKSKSRSRWTEMSYAKQLNRLLMDDERGDDVVLDCLTCCNDKVYALSHDTYSLLQIDIKVVKDKQVVISILPFQKYPFPYIHSLPDFYVIKGFGTELFLITGRFHAPAAATAVYLFKLDMATHDTTSTWEEIHDLKDAVFFVDLCNLQPVSYIPAVASSGLGGYVHIRDRRMIIYSFHVKDKILLLLPMPCLLKAIQVSMWEYYRGLEAGNDGEVKCRDDNKQEEEGKGNDDQIVVPTRSSSTEESRLLDVPFHVLEMIMEHCVGIEYMNFRATCKHCHLAAPRIHWRNKTAIRKLQKYSLASPWLMVVEVNGGIMNFTDPVSGDKYFMKLRLPTALSLNYDDFNSISCSKYGWLLFYTSSSNLGFDHHQLVFFNPFTNDVRKLPPTPPHYLDNLCFSAPPTSTNCMVVGFSTKGHAAYILRYHVDQLLLWQRFDVDYGGGGRAPFDFRFLTFHGRDLYALCNEGQLVVFKDMSEGRFSQPEVVAAEPPKCPLWLHEPQYFLMKRDQYLLVVIVSKFGGDPELFQFNDSTKEWNKIECLERHVIFIGDATCVCIEAKTLKMQNKIYFPRLKDGKIIFYSFETSKYHTFDGKATQEPYIHGFQSFCTTIHLTLHAWIEPTWY